MKKELFDDLLASAHEMVDLEQGNTPLPVERTHNWTEIDVRSIREATGMKQQDFAAAVGVSHDLVKSWESKRRIPLGASRKLLLLLAANPLMINKLKEI
ncbi:NadS family protein [Siccibacter turicensis]|uniref:NadS family protein n=1 Tax=Siccibacter turicensis TaxID=357233 RepID=UPI000466F2E9|nr:NadS family protein [Siccibacter turicensis]